MDFFFVRGRYLDQTNYHICLGDDLYCGSIQEAIILGPIQFDNSGKAQFSPRSIIIPACQYETLVNLIFMAYGSFKFEENVPEIPWDRTLFIYSKVHHLVVKFEVLENELTLRFLILWDVKNDEKWQKLVASGEKKALNTSQLEDKQWVDIKSRGINLKERHLEILKFQLPNILGSSFQRPGDVDVSNMVMGFVDNVIGNPELKEIITDNLGNFKNANFEGKMNILSQLLDKIYNSEEKHLKREVMFLFSNKSALLFSLLNYYFKQ